MRKGMPWTHIVAIDPSQRRSAVGILPLHGPLRDADIQVAGPVEDIGAFEPLLALSRDPEAVPFSVIECPTWNGLGTKEVRSAAVAWERHLKKLFRSRGGFRVDPRTWQNDLMHGVPGERMKDRAVWYCQNVLKIGEKVGDDWDMCDAACILTYGRIYLGVCR